LEEKKLKILGKKIGGERLRNWSGGKAQLKDGLGRRYWSTNRGNLVLAGFGRKVYFKVLTMGDESFERNIGKAIFFKAIF
jgi:hypothetical protein